MSELDFDMNDEAKLLGECVPKPELGNEGIGSSPQLVHL